MARTDTRSEADAIATGSTSAPTSAGRTPRPLVAAIAIGDGWAPAAAHRVVRLPADPTGYARALYATLHELDAAGCTLVVVTAPPADGAWRGIHDRLTRARH